MGNFIAPKPGQSVRPFVGDSSLWTQLIKMLNDWNEKKAERKGLSHSVCTPEVFNISVEDPIPVGDIRQLDDLAQVPVDPEAQRMMKYTPRFGGYLPQWQNGMDNVMPAHRFIDAGERGPVGSTRFIPIEINNPENPGSFLMVDPDNPGKLKPAHSGIYRILGRLEDNLSVDVAVVDTLQHQPLWRYEITGEPVDGVAPANLYDVNGDLYENDIDLTVPFPSETSEEGYCIHIGDEFYALTGGSASTPPTRTIKFRATADIANRSLPVVVLNSSSSATSTYAALTVYDPNNLWGAATLGCIGTAFYNAKRSQWEIQTCSLPANEIEVTLDEVMLADGSTYEAEISASYYLRSTYPNVMKPPQCAGTCTYAWNTSLQVWEISIPCPEGCTCAPAPDPPDDPDLGGQTVAMPCTSSEPTISIEFENPLYLDAMCDSKVILRRVSNADWGYSLESAPDASGSATEFKWVAVAVSKRKARWIKFTFENEAAPVEVTDSWDGWDPTPCGPVEVSYPLGVPCEGDVVVASYDPAADTYMAIDTRASMLGTPFIDGVVTNVTGTDCGIALTKTPVQLFMTPDCDATPTTTDVPLGTTVPIVQSIAADGACGFNYVKQNARVFLCGSAADVIAVELEGEDIQVMTGASFGPPTCSDSTWEYTLENGWEETIPCAAGCTSNMPTDNPTSSETRLVPCNADANASCGLNYSMTTVRVCGSSPFVESGHAHLPLVSLPVVVNVSKQVDGIHVDRETIYVCNYTGGASTVIPTTPCESGSGGPNPCSQNAILRWDNLGMEWLVHEPCAAGCEVQFPLPPPPENPDIVQDIEHPCEPGGMS